MLDALQRPRLSIGRVFSLIFILNSSTGLMAAESKQPQVLGAHSYFEYFTEYFNAISEDTDVDEVIDNLILMRQAMINQGVECPTLKQLCRDMIKYICGHCVDVESDVLREFIERVERRELEYIGHCRRPQVELVRSHHRHRHEDKKKGAKMGSKGVFGFIKVLAGALTTLLPVPGAQAVGLALIGFGINEIIDDTRERGDENERLQQMDEQRRREEELLKEPVLP